jgi:hypothetical protein
MLRQINRPRDGAAGGLSSSHTYKVEHRDPQSIVHAELDEEAAESDSAFVLRAAKARAQDVEWRFRWIAKD